MTKGGAFIIPESSLPAIFTISDLNDDHKMIRESIASFVAENITTDVASKKIELKDWEFTKKILRDLARLGYLGIEIPEEYGGMGLDKISATIVAEEIAKQGSFAATFLAHTGIGTLPIRFFGTEEQKRKYLPMLASGDSIAAYSLTEAGAGSDARSVKTKAVLSSDGSHFILNGEKKFVTNGGLASVFTVFAKIDGDKGITAFIVERGFPGVVVGKEEHKMGIQGSSTTDLILQDAIVPVDNLLGERQKGFKEIALNILNLGRFKLGAACLGAGRMCLEEALKYAKERKQFGVSIVEFGAIRHKLALMAAKNYAMESMVYRTAGYLEEAIGQVDEKDSRAVLRAIEEFAVECSLVKTFCTEALDYIVDENVQIHGASGFCEGNPERHHRDSRINRIFEGTNEINRILAVGMELKKVVSGVLPVAAQGKKILEEATAFSLQNEPENLVNRLFGYLNGAKKSFLVVCDTVSERFKPILDGGKELEKHQIVLMGLADCMIEIYKMESVLAAFAKSQNQFNENLIRLIFHESLADFEKLIKELVVMCSVGDDQKTRASIIRKLLKFSLENKEELCNKIVGHLLKK